MSNHYTENELQGMSRVQLRRAAIEVLKIDNKEASNSKSGDLITRILEMEDGGNGSVKEAAKKAAPTNGKGRASAGKKAKSNGNGKAKAVAAAPANGVGELVDAVGRAVDETKEELGARIDTVLANQDSISRQLYILFGLLCDVYKAVDEPDALEERLNELDEEWEARGNE